MKNKKFIKAYLLRLLTQKKQSTFDIKSSKKVLILKYDRIGDMIVTTPIFRELKQAYPDISISVLASDENKSVIKYNPFIDKIYTNYKNNLLIDLKKLLFLRMQKFDVCIELEHSVIPHALFRLKIINPKKIISIYKDGRYGVNGSELKLYDFFTNRDKENHFGKMWLDTLMFFDINPRSNAYDFFIGDIERNRATLFVKSFDKKIKIGINLEGSGRKVETFIYKNELKKICVGLHNNLKNIIIVIISRPEFLIEKKQLISELGLDFVIPSYGTNSIIDAAALIEQLDLIISPDTSIVHIASAFDKPIVSIHENDKDSFRLWAPNSSKSKTIFASKNSGYSVDELVKSSSEFLKQIETDK